LRNNSPGLEIFSLKAVWFGSRDTNLADARSVSDSYVCCTGRSTSCTYFTMPVLLRSSLRQTAAYIQLFVVLYIVTTLCSGKSRFGFLA